MENNQETPPNSKNLKELPYSELKKLAKKHGIKGNMKAEKIIAALNSSGIETFFTPEQIIMNSSKKNKEAKFDGDQSTPVATPRRGTYSLETPSSLKVDDVVDRSLLDMSNVTVSRGSERKLRRRKVSFMSPLNTPSTPKNSTLRLRPKTPVAYRTSIGKRVSFSTPAKKSKKKSSLPTTPLPKNSISEENSDFSSGALEKSVVVLLPRIEETPVKQTEEMTDDTTTSEMQNENKPASKKPVMTKNEVSLKEKKIATPGSVKFSSLKNTASALIKQAATPGSAKSVVPKSDTASKIKRVATPSSAKSVVPKSDTASKIKRVATPNFKKIHQKAFEKMESIDDYQKRKAMDSAKKIIMRPDPKSKVTKAKSKIPSYSGIPFVSSSKMILQENKKQKLEKCTDSVKVSEIATKRNKTKFDLKASLSRKLGYKPYKGPLKPLAESNNLNVSMAAGIQNVREPINIVVANKRMETRSLIRGVRTNKRFELQMKNRKLD